MAARSPSSGLHKYFEWSDAKAAENFRLVQARNLVNHINVVVKIEGKWTETKAFHNIRIVVDEAIQHRYEKLEFVSSNGASAAQVIKKALNELVGWRERYKQYRQIFGGVFDEIDKASSKVNGKRKKAKAS